MNRMLRVLMSLVILSSISAYAVTKVQKKVPSDADVKKELEAAGAEHYPKEDIKKLKKEGSSKVGETYLHVFSAEMRSGGYRVIFFDNAGKYLGYYPSDAEVSDVQDGGIVFDSGDSGDDDGSSDDEEVQLTADGPPATAEINGASVAFVKAPEKKEEEKK